MTVLAIIGFVAVILVALFVSFVAGYIWFANMLLGAMGGRDSTMSFAGIFFTIIAVLLWWLAFHLSPFTLSINLH